MSATPPPGYTPPPADLPQRGDRATFSDRVDAWVTWFSTAILAQIAAIAANVYANALDGAASAVASAGFRDTAEDYRDAAQAARDAAEGYRDTALTYRNQAQGFATDAQNYAAALTATSTTSLVIGVGTKVFATQSGKQFGPNQTLKAVNPTNAAQYMVGTATYSGTTLTLAVTDVNPATSGNTVANWVIAPSGEKGATGPTGGVAGGNLTGALNEKQGPGVAFSATPDIWSGAGNSLTMTGAGTITGFPNAPQSGAKRTILIGGGPVVFQQNASMVVYGGTQTATIGDQVDVVALEGVGAFWVNIRRRDGTATVGAKPYMVVLTSGSTWTVDAVNFEVEVQAAGQGGFNNGNLAGGQAGWAGIKCFRDAVVGSTALISIGGASTPGTASTAPAVGGSTSFTLSGFTALTASSSGVTGADRAIPPRPPTAAVGTLLAGSGGDSHNGYGGILAEPANVAKNANGFGAGGGGGDGQPGDTGGLATGGCIIIRYFK